MKFRLLTEADVRAVLTMEDLIETMSSALRRFSTGRVVHWVDPQVVVDRLHSEGADATARGTPEQGPACHHDQRSGERRHGDRHEASPSHHRFLVAGCNAARSSAQRTRAGIGVPLLR